MKRFVVDANVLMAALKKDGRVRGLLLGAPPHVAFYAPDFLWLEIDGHLDELADDAGVPRIAIEAVMRVLRSRITVIPAEATEPFIEDARRRAAKADALGDEEYVGVALALGAPVWSFDKDFDRVAGVERVGSDDVEAAFDEA